MKISLNLRGIAADVLEKLRQKAKRQSISINALILKLIEENLDHSPKKYNDLDHLAGTWTSEEGDFFKRSIDLKLR